MKDAIENKLGMVHQHFMLVDVMTALENITLGEKKAGFFVHKNQIKEKVEKVIKSDPDLKVAIENIYKKI